MSRLPALTRLAFRELWISYQLIPIIGLPILAGLAVSVVPPELAGLGAVAGAAHWLAIGLTVALPMVGAMAAATLAADNAVASNALAGAGERLYASGTHECMGARPTLVP